MKEETIKKFLFLGILLLFAVNVSAGDNTGGKKKLQTKATDKNQTTKTEVIEQTLDISEKAPIISEPVTSSTRAGEQIKWQVISGGGTDGSSTNFNLMGTVGQTADGNGVSTNYKLAHGFWQTSGMGPCDCQPGEADGADLVNILDIVFIINFKYKGGPVPMPYATCSADTDCDCVVNILDIVYRINFQYKGGLQSCTCEEWVTECGSLR